MILKEKVLQAANSATAKAGQKQELDVAFYLRRAFKDHNRVHVLNDLKFSHNEETAQIDHLILYPYGFILIESKSITGEVTVNGHEEWSRSFQGKWRGMPSPIKQVELQQQLLRAMLCDRAEEILDKLVFGKLQKNFGGRCWDSYCAISSNAIIDRDKAPIDVANRLVKSEFIVDVIKKKMNLPRFDNKALKIFGSDARAWFSDLDLKNIATFLLENSKNSMDSEIARQLIADNKIEEPQESIYSIPRTLPKENDINECDVSAVAVLRASKVDTPTSTVDLKCKKCGEPEKLIANWGKFGYYVKCNQCETNTSMKQSCPSCHSKNTKLHKKKKQYKLDCGDCEFDELIFTQVVVAE